MTDCCPLPSTGVSEQWEWPGPQAREEGTEGQSDPGRPPGFVLQHLATFFHHQHGAGKRRNLSMKIKRSAESMRLFVFVYLFFPSFFFDFVRSHVCDSLLVLFFVHASVRWVLKQSKNTRKTTLGDRSIFVLTSFRITALTKQSNKEMDWRFGFVCLTHCNALNAPIPFRV